MPGTTAIIRLYNEFTDGGEVLKSPEYLEFVSKSNELKEQVKKIIGEKVHEEVEDCISYLALEYEQYGFISGFKYAVQLMTECGIKSPIKQV